MALTSMVNRADAQPIPYLAARYNLNLRFDKQNLNLSELLMQASNNMMIGIAENRCPGNVISGNTLRSNHDEGVTADNQSNNAQVKF